MDLTTCVVVAEVAHQTGDADFRMLQGRATETVVRVKVMVRVVHHFCARVAGYAAVLMVPVWALSMSCRTQGQVDSMQITARLRLRLRGRPLR